MKKTKSKIKVTRSVTRFTNAIEDISDSFDIYIMFIDLCDSTSLKQICLDSKIPDMTWIIRQRIFLERSATIITKYKGDLIKTIGDELMATFNVSINPIDIISCCAEIIQTFDNLKTYNSGEFKIFSKISLDFGTCYDGTIINLNVVDPIGTPVDRCARISKFAGKNEIVLSHTFYSVLEEREFNFNELEMIEKEEELKGLGKIKFYKVILQ